MTVSELARRAGVTADTVRHYTRSGLLVPIRDKSNGYNCYHSGDLARLSFIRKARLPRFSLGDVSDILKEGSHGHSPCPQVRKIMEQLSGKRGTGAFRSLALGRPDPAPPAEGNPEFATIWKGIRALGIRLHARPA